MRLQWLHITTNSDFGIFWDPSSLQTGPRAHYKPFFPSNMSSTLTTSWSLYLNKILGQKLGDSKAPHSSHNMTQGNTPNPIASSLARMFETQAHNQQPMQKSTENMNLAHIKRPSCSKAVAQPTLKGN